MKTKIGIFFVVIGLAFLLGALGLFSYNQYQQQQAQKSVESIMPQLVERINANIAKDTESEEQETNSAPEGNQPEAEKSLPVVEIDGNRYIGFVSLPTLGLELPVMADWSYDKLNVAPCVYSGSYENNDLVIMAHNYVKHFGGLSNLSERDIVKFTDMNGNVTTYTVVVTDMLSEVDIENMTAGEFDLTLFTCNYDGKSRITIRCDRQ